MAFDTNDLSPHEHFVVERTRAGEMADLTPMAGPGGVKPAVRAGFLRKLLLQLDPSWPVRTPGVRLQGARLEGSLDLTDCTGAGATGLPALALANCEIADPIDISHARLARFSLRGSRLAKLLADEAQIDGELDLCGVSPLGEPGFEALVVKARGLRVDGDVLARGAKLARAADSDDDALMLQGAEIAGNVLLDGGFDAFGCVWIMHSRIAGGLSLENAQILNRTDSGDGQAINADGAEIGSLLLRSFKAEGEVRFVSARVLRDIDISGGAFRNDGAVAINFANAEIAGQLWGDGAKITGQVLLQGARIARNIDLRGAEIAPRAAQRGDAYGRAIDATSMSVGGAALLHGANVKGEVLLADARIQGYLAFGGGRYINPGHWAIRAPNVRVGGNLTFKIAESGYAPLGQKTVIEGGAKFDRAQIEGAFAWSALELRGAGPENSKGGAFSIADARIGGPLQARNLVAQEGASIDASGANCAVLDDDVKTGWGPDGVRLDLEGFAYGRLENANDRWRQRLSWLRRARRDGERFSPQPYTHLAQVYAKAGLREDARRILLAQHDVRTARASAGPLTWALSSAFGLVAGYGLAPIRIVRALALFLALGVAGVLTMNAQGALVRPDGTACNGAIEPALYAVDVALPVIDLGQEGRCAPGRTARADLPAGMEIEGSDWRLFEGAALWKWAHAVYAVLGAILTALAVITFSGVMKPRDD